MDIKLSILIPSIPSRVEKYLIPLYNKIVMQTIPYPEVEILVLLDNKKRTIGMKRDALVQLAKGKYQIQIDDDDDVSPDFVSSLMDVINEDKDYDLIMFDQFASINGENLFTVEFGLHYPNEECKKVDDKWIDVKRSPFHNMCWKSSLAKTERFPDASYGEDWHWAKRLITLVNTHVKIDKKLTYYFYNDKITEAEAIFPK